MAVIMQSASCSAHREITLCSTCPVPWHYAIETLTIKIYTNTVQVSPSFSFLPVLPHSDFPTSFSHRLQKVTRIQTHLDTTTFAARQHSTATITRHVRKMRQFFSKYVDHKIAKYAAKICGNRRRLHIHVNLTWYKRFWGPQPLFSTFKLIAKLESTCRPNYA